MGREKEKRQKERYKWEKTVSFLTERYAVFMLPSDKCKTGANEKQFDCTKALKGH